MRVFSSTTRPGQTSANSSLVAPDHAVALAHQHAQHVEGLGGQRHPGAVQAVQLTGARIEDEAAEPASRQLPRGGFTAFHLFSPVPMAGAVPAADSGAAGGSAQYRASVPGRTAGARGGGSPARPASVLTREPCHVPAHPSAGSGLGRWAAGSLFERRRNPH
ncbi:hypothetical protein, partial [Pseudoxanthomonas taiwanensis]|uniref:hypothetical protein n=1 Tax=Pseudoxanthomonas taiwanensis TaxID=176598 RepID=UPI001B874955